MTGRLLYVVNEPWFFLSHRAVLAQRAREAGWDVHVATPRGEGEDEIARRGFTFHPIYLTRSALKPWTEARAVAGLVSLYRRVRPALVHHVTPKPVLYGTIAARLTGVPGVVNALAGLGHAFSGPPSWMSRAATAAFRTALGHPNSAAIFQNEDDRAHFVDSRIVRPQAAHLIRGSGVDPAEYRPAAPPPGPPLVLLASRLLVSKGVLVFVEAARRLRAEGVDARFVLAGRLDAGNPASLTEAQLEELRREGVVEVWGNRSDMPAVFAQTAIACLPTYYREGVPKFLIEACFSAVVPVTTDVPGCRDLVEDGVTGRVIPPRDVDALVAALRPLIADAGLRRAMGERARAKVLREYSVDAVTSATLSVYKDIVARVGPGKHSRSGISPQ